jgi:multimeric flavodoxin WrbA
VTDKKGNKLILHDLDIETAGSLFKYVSDAKIFCAAKKMSKCTGCFGCWLKTPALCVIRDGTEYLGGKIARCDEFIIISRNLYGGFSREIKNALDRSISAVLPFFDVRNGEMHHQMRYSESGAIKAYIYNSGGISDTDKAALTELTKANGININKSGYETVFVLFLNELKEVLI